MSKIKEALHEQIEAGQRSAANAPVNFMYTVTDNETAKYKYLIRVKSDYFRRKFPDFDNMDQRHKDDLMNKEFEYITSILKEKSGMIAIFFFEDFNIDKWSGDVEIYPLEDREEVKFEGEEVPKGERGE